MTRDLIETHLPRVYRFAVYMIRDHHAAEDIAQEAMLRAWRRRDECRSEAIVPWLLRITANLCHDYVRRRQHVVSRAVPLDPAPESRERLPWEAMALEEQRQVLQELIDRLPERERSVLYLSAFEQLSHGEIAEVLQLNAGSVRVALSRARCTLREKALLRDKQREHKS